MKKHSYNIFPEASPEDFNRLLEDIRSNGFDLTQPITIYNGEVLDGWNRTKACDILNIKPRTVVFTGSDPEAIAFVMRTNKRRNLNKGQWACIAAEAEDLLFAIGQEAKKSQVRKPVDSVTQKIEQGSRNDRATATKAAELFNTNRTYVNQAVKMREKAPEVFEKVKAGKMTMQDARKAIARKPTEPEWLPDEIKRKKKVEDGGSVVANFQRDKHLIQWATDNGKMVPIDRSSKWGNPFIMGPDGDREHVCNCFENYADMKRSFSANAGELKGKVLCCHCYPEQCHGSSLIEMFASK